MIKFKRLIKKQVLWWSVEELLIAIGSGIVTAIVMLIIIPYLRLI